MNITYKFPFYRTYANPDFGLYKSTDGNLGSDLENVLKNIRGGSTAPLAAPALPGFVCSGRMVGGSYCLTLTKMAHENGEPLDLPIPVCTCYFAVSDEDVEALCKDALEEMEKAGVNEPYPSFKLAMRSLPEAPFTAFVPWKGADTALRHDLLTFEEIELCTGYMQTIIGHAAEQEEFTGFDAKQGDAWTMTDMDLYVLTPDDISTAIQTGGALHSEIIVDQGEDGYPRVYAYIIDTEKDLFRVDFEHNALIIDTDGMSYLSLDAETLTLINDLREEANAVWEEIDSYSEEIDEAIFADADVDDEVEDPIAHLYTNHVPVEVSPNMAKRLMASLMLAPRYASTDD